METKRAKSRESGVRIDNTKQEHKWEGIGEENRPKNKAKNKDAHGKCPVEGGNRRSSGVHRRGNTSNEVDELATIFARDRAWHAFT